ncbi:MAG: adenylyltransferase/cytidyltransferase family protein [Elusimicrobia bacterium]|nr:adenylyltransferase/cytidyltransferase family protein [Elusimicrobiota bacterium]
MKINKSVLSSLSLLRVLRPLRRGKTVVFTNGCFDLVHAGHLKVLEWAKRQGDILVVGLNSDASVRRLKGPRRPILPLADRAVLMAALKPVDYVTWFSEETPHALIRRLRPDILVKGGDWASDSIVGREFVKKVVRVPLLKGRSTSGIISTINRRYGSDGNSRAPSSAPSGVARASGTRLRRAEQAPEGPSPKRGRKQGLSLSSWERVG